jgi:predicted transcriptional regulator
MERNTKWSVKLGSFAGIRVYVHWTTYLFISALRQKHRQSKRLLWSGLHVRDTMMTRFRALAAEDSLDTATRELLAGSQQDFPVLADGKVGGILRRNDLVQALAQGSRPVNVGNIMCRDCCIVSTSEPLDQTLERMRQQNCATLAVMDDDKLVGLLTLENIGELIMVRSAAAKAGRDRV